MFVFAQCCYTVDIVVVSCKTRQPYIIALIFLFSTPRNYKTKKKRNMKNFFIIMYLSFALRDGGSLSIMTFIASVWPFKTGVILCFYYIQFNGLLNIKF